MSVDRRGVAALIGGACAIGVGPILVRWAEAGPAVTAFWRIGLAVPLMTLLAARSSPNGRRIAKPSEATVWAGVMFAADIGLWHYGLHLTSVANATLLSNLTPIGVTFVAWAMFKERPSGLFLGALALAIGGCALIGIARGGGGQGSDPPLGNALSAVVAVFYAAYFLFVRKARETAGAAEVMLWSGLISAPMLLIAGALLGERLAPVTWRGWAAVAGLGVMHIAGQGGIAWGLGRVPTAFAAVAVLVQPVVAAVLGLVLLGEAITPLQAVGGVIVLAGVALAQLSRRAQAPPPPDSAAVARAAAVGD